MTAECVLSRVKCPVRSIKTFRLQEVSFWQSFHKKTQNLGKSEKLLAAFHKSLKFTFKTNFFTDIGNKLF